MAKNKLRYVIFHAFSRTSSPCGPNILRLLNGHPSRRFSNHVSGTCKNIGSSITVCARMGDGRGVHRVLVGKPEGNRPLGRPRRRWEDNIKMDLQEVGGVETGWSWLRIGTGGGHL